MAKVEGKGNGIKTVIVNMAEVAKAIGRPATCNKNKNFNWSNIFNNSFLLIYVRSN